MLNPIFIYLILVALLIIVIAIYAFFFVSVYGTLKTCERSESSYCPLMYCKDLTVECGNYPWRPDPVTGKPICSEYLLTMTALKAVPKTGA